MNSRHLCRSYIWTFVVADVHAPILGMDFLSKHGLIVDCSDYSITDKKTQMKTRCQTAMQPILRAVLMTDNSIPNEINDLFCQFPKILQPIQQTCSPECQVKHVIETGTKQPVFSRPRQLNGEKLSCAKQEFRSMLQSGIVRPSKSPWASSLHMVRKSDGTWRPCGDYRALNAITVPDRYPLPHIQYTTQGLSGSSIYSKIDLKKAYYQVPMSEKDIEKTAVTTPFGLFEFTRMPFGLRNAAQTFQRLMDEIFRDLEFVAVYIDDILVFSESKEEHIQHLKEVIK